MKSIQTLFIVLIAFICSAQVAPNFVVTDVDGNTHNLYTDYLDQDKVVVLKIFFRNCPPCNSAAPTFQARYVEWGSGTMDVQFIELTNKLSDSDNVVLGYKNQHSLTFPLISAEGGGVAAQGMYTDGTFGPFYGTPHYMVIAPDKTVQNGVSLGNLNQAIMDALPTMTAPTTPVKFTANGGSTAIPSGVTVYMKPANASGPVLNVGQLTNDTYEFEYPSANFPTMVDPIIYISSTNNAQDGSIRVGDLIPIRKHILGLEEFTDDRDFIKADVDADDRIRVNDLVEIRKVILGLTIEYPNNVPSFRLYPEVVDFDVSGTNLVTIDLEILKMGNIQD
jgi:peroxiredoxin